MTDRYKGLVDLIVISLATWRLAALLIYEEGPWHLMTRLRERFGIIHEDDEPVGWPTSMPGSIFKCMSCMGLWVAPVVMLLGWLAPPVVWALGLSGAANLLESRAGDGD